MISRNFWVERIQSAWKRAPIVWLTGVRRVGKTTLAKALPEALYINCDLPRHQEQLRDPEFFFRQVKTPVVILDEVHRLEDPSGVLKIGADEFPQLRILATGSSTLAATRKFRDSLTGRKRVVYLPPVLASELPAFGGASIQERLLRGGMPQRILDDNEDPEFYSEWLDSYFARDIQELFRVSKRMEFLKLVELLIRRNGSLLEITSMSREVRITRPTVSTYLDILETTHVIRRLRPYHRGGRREILAQPKCYVFDTGFVAYYNGWATLRPDECGTLYENLVLDELSARLPLQTLHYWRDKQQREIDFVIPQPDGICHTIECKWNPAKYTTRNLKAFRANYPLGRNFVVSPNLSFSSQKRIIGFELAFCTTEELPHKILN